MCAKRRTAEPAAAEILGLSTPVMASAPGVKVSAWRDTDKPRGARKYHVVAKLSGQAERDFFAMTPQSIKALAEQLLEVHRQLMAPDESTQKLPRKPA